MEIKLNQKKVLKVQNLEEFLNQNKGVALYETKGLLANEINEIRKMARENEIKIVISKNSFWKIAFSKGLNIEKESLPISGNILALVSDDVVKSLSFYNKLNKNYKKLLSPILAIDKGGFIIKPNIIKDMINAQSKVGVVGGLIMTLKAPAIKLIKLLTIVSEKQV